MTGEFDVVIVGGGSAGAVLASRLCQDGTRRVLLLLEAGEAYRPNLYPPDLANADATCGRQVRGRGGPAQPGRAAGWVAAALSEPDGMETRISPSSSDGASRGCVLPRCT